MKGVSLPESRAITREFRDEGTVAAAVATRIRYCYRRAHAIWRTDMHIFEGKVPAELRQWFPSRLTNAYSERKASIGSR